MFLGLMVFGGQLWAEKLDSTTVTYKDVSLTIKLGDELKLGYGKTPYGSFQYIEYGSPAQSLDKEGGGKTGTVTMIRSFPKQGIVEVFIKIKGLGYFTIQIQQAVDIGEVIGINGVIFNQE